MAVYTFNKGRFRANLTGHDGEVTAVIFLPGYPAMISADAEGFLYFWPVPPAPQKHQYHPWTQWHCSAHSISALHFDAEEKMLFVGDDYGRVSGWSLKGLLEGPQPWMTDEKTISVRLPTQDEIDAR